MYFSFNDIEPEEESVLRKVFKPVVCMGRQPGSNVSVFGSNLLFKSDGTLIASDEQDYIVIPEIIQKLGLGGALAPIEEQPVVPNPLCTVLTGIKRIAGFVKNFSSHEGFIRVLYPMQRFVKNFCSCEVLQQCYTHVKNDCPRIKNYLLSLY